MTRSIHNQSGFTVLFAVLVASILLAVGASIFNITVKNLLFSSSGRDSLKAFSAADAGLECAQYWDRNSDGIFGAHDVKKLDPSEEIKCMGVVLINTEDEFPGPATGWDVSGPTSDGVVTSRFSINTESFGTGGAVCATVTVTKKATGALLENGQMGTRTIIDSRGYNTCDDTNPRRLERGVKLTYDEI